MPSGCTRVIATAGWPSRTTAIALGAGHEGADDQVPLLDVRPEHPERIGVAGRGQAIERGGA